MAHYAAVRGMISIVKWNLIKNGKEGMVKDKANNSSNADPKLSLRGCRLAWSRLVDLGSIDPGSNPGSPTHTWVRRTLLVSKHGSSLAWCLCILLSEVSGLKGNWCVLSAIAVIRRRDKCERDDMAIENSRRRFDRPCYPNS